MFSVTSIDIFSMYRVLFFFYQDEMSPRYPTTTTNETRLAFLRSITVLQASRLLTKKRLHWSEYNRVSHYVFSHIYIPGLGVGGVGVGSLKSPIASHLRSNNYQATVPYYSTLHTAMFATNVFVSNYGLSQFRWVITH